MFITFKRHERGKQESLGAAARLNHALFEHSDQGMFLLDATERVLPPTSKSLASLFRRDDFGDLTFEKLLAPIVSARTLTMLRGHLTALLADVPGTVAAASSTTAQAASVLEDIEVRVSNPGGASLTAHYRFDFAPVEVDAGRAWLVRDTDITQHIETQRALDDLRSRSEIQGEVLQGVLQKGGARFGKFLQTADSAMKTIDLVLKKSAREEAAFRAKLDATLDEVDRIRREAEAFQFTALEAAAAAFEDSLHALRGRPALSGGDFLPLAVKLDQLFTQFALIKSLALPAVPPRDAGHGAPSAPASPPVAAAPQPTSDQATQIIAAPRFDGHPATPAPAAAAGSLEYTLQTLTGHISQDLGKEVFLEIRGLDLLPPKYQAAVKNVAIQLIRNAVMHGIEAPALREAAGKALHGTLRLEFRQREDQRYELTFEDDGRGLDPDAVRATAVLRQVVTHEVATRMRDREAIKLIFKSRFTTLGTSPDDTTHGAGMSMVRRYVQEAGGTIALASLAGHETRFKIVLPALMQEDARVA